MMQLPNTLGFLFGIIQMVMYLIYRNAKTNEPTKSQELNAHEIVDVGKMSTMELTELNHETGGAVSEITIEDPNGNEGHGNPKNIMNSHRNL